MSFLIPNPQQAQLVEKINRMVRQQGNVDLILKLDQIMDQKTEADKTAALSAIVKQVNELKSKKRGS